MIPRSSALLLTVILSLALAVVAQAFQGREHLTSQEIDLVKDAQILDKRIDVFIKAADRRMLVLNGADTSATKQLKKDSETWGELPTGSRAELIGDIAKIFDEAITNIDDVSSRDENNPLIPKAPSQTRSSSNISSNFESLRRVARRTTLNSAVSIS